jgi:hypothetical protein
MGLDDQAEKRRQAVDWLWNGTADQHDAAVEYLDETLRPWCPLDCGCRLGPDHRGNFDADMRECDCDGACTSAQQGGRRD